MLFTRILVLWAGLQLTSALFFMVHRADTKCFTFEQPQDTPIVFAYEILDEKHSVEFSLFYGTLALPQLQIMNKTLTNPIGHVDYTADNNGAYSVCVQQAPMPSVAFPTRFSLSISYGYDADHYIKLAKEHDFDVLNMEIHKLNDIMTMTLNEADFQKHKEVAFHQDTENMNIETIWWPIVQILILVIAGYVQVLHLKNFFKSRKLI